MNLLFQAEEAKTIKINRNCSFIKVTTTPAYIVVIGWNEHKKEVVYLLYDSNLKFRDEITLKQSITI